MTTLITVAVTIVCAVVWLGVLYLFAGMVWEAWKYRKYLR